MKQLFTILLICTIVFFYSDVEATVKLICPEDIELGCNPKKIPIPNPNNLEYETDCKKAKVKLIDQLLIEDDENCKNILTLTYEATDRCGDTDQCTMTITWMIDKDPPIIMNCLEEIDLGCNPNEIPAPDFEQFDAKDNCGIKEVVLHSEKRKQTKCKVTLTRTYRVYDLCGNYSTCKQILTWMEDDDPPFFTSCPEDIDLGCDRASLENTLDPDKVKVKAKDDCGPVEIEYLGVEVDIDECTIIYVQTWKATDICGNMSFCSREVSVTNDLDPPIIIACPPSGYLGCFPEDGQPDINNYEDDLVVEDACGWEIVVTLDTFSLDGCSRSFSKLWVVEDECGNQASCYQKVSWDIDDGEGPTFTTCPPDLDLGCNPNLQEYVNPLIEAVDECGEVKINREPDQTIPLGECVYKLIQTWTAVDGCGNESTCARVLKYTINEKPFKITFCPPNIDFGCVGDDFEVPDPTPEQVEYENECGQVKVLADFFDLEIGDCCSKLTRYYVAIPECGEPDTCTQILTWCFEETPPVFTACPQDLDLGCNPDLDVILKDPDLNIVRAEDECGEVKITYEGESALIDGCITIVTQTWKATDRCGNESFCNRTITFINDTTPPVVTNCPPDIDLGCFPEPIEFVDDDPVFIITGEDECGEVTITSLGYEEEIEGCIYIRKYVWALTDPCGNASYCSRIVKFTVDPNPPVITVCPPDIDYGCVGDDFQLPDPDPDAIQFEDDCGAKLEIIPFTDIVVFNCTYNYGYLYVVTDACGNADSCVQRVSWTIDNTPPVFTSCPPDLDLGCNPDLTIVVDPSVNAVAAEDFCGEVIIERLEDEIFEGENCNFKRIQRWKATDRCGNMSFCERIIKYSLDENPPVITQCPPDRDFGCVGDDFQLPDPDPDAIQFEDDCGAKLEIIPFTDIVVFNCTYNYGYLYVVTDACGNADSCVQRVSWTIDNTPPVFTSCPPDLDLGCNPDLTIVVDPSVNAVAAEDFCGEVIIERLEDEIFEGENCNFKRIQRWKATDRCGNMSFCERIIKYSLDENPPVITQCPPDRDFGCVGDDFQLPDPDPDAIQFEDDCGAKLEIIPFTDIVVFNCTYNYGYLYVVTDACGNADSCIQRVSWTIDNTPPVFTSCPPDLDLGCNPDLTIVVDPSVNAVAAEDFCGEVIIERLEDEIFEGENCNFKRIQRWKATDRCGNMSFCERIIKYSLDENPPVITQCPPDRDYGCVGDDFQLPDPDPDAIQFEDDCGAKLEIIPFTDIVVFNCTYNYGYLYVVTDACGNADSCVQRVSWTIDNTPPVFTSCPPDLDLGCNPDLTIVVDPSVNAVAAEDFCGEVIIERLEDEIFEGENCNFKRIQRWKATDRCGNMSFCERIIKYSLDENPPVITQCPPDRDFGCVGDDFQLPDPDPDAIQFEDDCGAKLEIIPFTDIVVFNCTYNYGYLYVVTDACGNADSCVQRVSWTIDDTPPIFKECPPNLDLGCNPDLETLTDPSLNEIFAEDDCGEVTIERLEDEVIEENCNVRRIQRWKATDICGNMDTCQRIISYTIDKEGPKIIECPESINYGCVERSPEIPPFDPDKIVVEDACGISAIIHTDQLIEVSECYFIYRRFIVVIDNCENTTNCVQEFRWTLIDGQVIDVPFPEDIEVFCNEIPEIPQYDTVTNCGVNVPFFVEEVIDGECDTGNCIIRRTWIKTDCFGNETNHTQTIRLSCEEPTAVRNVIGARNSEIGYNQDLKIYPNPGIDDFQLEFSVTLDEPYKIEIKDISGVLISNIRGNGMGETTQFRYDASKLLPGIYLISLKSKETNISKKWIKTQ